MSLFQQIELQNLHFLVKKVALEDFLSKGFPTKKDEEYKYTNLKEIVEKITIFLLQSIILSPKNN